MFRQDRCHPWVGQVFVDRHDASFGKPVGLGRDDLPDARPNQHDSVHLIPTNTEWGKGGVGRGSVARLSLADGNGNGTDKFPPPLGYLLTPGPRATF